MVTVPNGVPVRWPRASRLVPARFRAAECFERIQDADDPLAVERLARLSGLTATGGGLEVMDPAQVLFGAGAGWINAAFLVPRPGRFSTGQRGAFYLAGDLETSLAEVRFAIQRTYRKERVAEPLDLDYRALTAHLEGIFPDIRDKPKGRAPWSRIYAPDAWAEGQAFAGRLRDQGCKALIYASLRRPGGACAAVFDPDVVRACRHDTYLTFHWDGQDVSQVFEKRLLPFGRA